MLSINTEKSFNKTQYPVLIITFGKLRIEKDLVKNIYSATLQLTSCFIVTTCFDLKHPPSTPIQHCTGNLS